MFKLFNLAKNIISAEGLLYIGHVEWNNLNYLDLSLFSLTSDQNQLGNKGCKYLSLIRCKFMENLYVSNYFNN